MEQVISPKQYKEFLLALLKLKEIDKWEVWKYLYNSGVRGKDLNGFLLNVTYT